MGMSNATFKVKAVFAMKTKTVMEMAMAMAMAMLSLGQWFLVPLPPYALTMRFPPIMRRLRELVW